MPQVRLSPEVGDVTTDLFADLCRGYLERIGGPGDKKPTRHLHAVEHSAQRVIQATNSDHSLGKNGRSSCRQSERQYDQPGKQQAR
jgi:hypothetical protein